MPCPSPMCGNLITMGWAWGWEEEVITSATQWKRWFPALPGAGGERPQCNPPVCQGKWEGSWIISSHTPQHIYKRKMEDFTFLQKCSLASSVIAQRININISTGNTIDWVGQVLLIETQEIFLRSGLQSHAFCYPRKTHHDMLLINYLA